MMYSIEMYVKALVAVLFANNVASGFKTASFAPETTCRGASTPLQATPSRNSEALPFLKCPTLLTGEFAGDVGFDPLGLAKNREQLIDFREAEMKHSRLAMLAAIGWPVSELLDKPLADELGLDSILDANDRVPSLLNGGLDKVSPLWWGFCLGLTAAIDLYGVQRARFAEGESEYSPGDFGFDPLGLYPSDKEGQDRMRLAEIKHGRLSMIAVLGFAVQEAVTHVGVVDETPIFFSPISL